MSDPRIEAVNWLKKVKNRDVWKYIDTGKWAVRKRDSKEVPLSLTDWELIDHARSLGYSPLPPDITPEDTP